MIVLTLQNPLISIPMIDFNNDKIHVTFFYKIQVSFCYMYQRNIQN